jgi:hypothetical protein
MTSSRLPVSMRRGRGPVGRVDDQNAAAQHRGSHDPAPVGRRRAIEDLPHPAVAGALVDGEVGGIDEQQLVPAADHPLPPVGGPRDERRQSAPP